MAYKTDIKIPGAGKLNVDDDIFLMEPNDSSDRMNVISTQEGGYSIIENVKGFSKSLYLGSNVFDIKIPVFRRMDSEYNKFEYYIPEYERFDDKIPVPYYIKISYLISGLSSPLEHSYRYEGGTDFWINLKDAFIQFENNVYSANEDFHISEYYRNIKFYSTNPNFMGFNVEVNFIIEDLNNIEIVGYTEDKEDNTIYLFARDNNLGFSSILRYSKDGSLITLVPFSYILNLQNNTKIDANIVGSGDEKLLIWTDGVNPPRKLLVNKMINTQKHIEFSLDSKSDNEDFRYFYFSDEDIYAGAIPPSESPDVYYVSDTYYKQNDLRGNLWQFAYRYIYDDDSISVWSEFALPVFPEDEEELNLVFINEITKNNKISISAKTKRNVKRVEFGCRKADIGGGVPGEFFVFDNIDVDEYTRFVPGILTTHFSGLEYMYTVPESELNKLHDYIPITARSQEIIKDTILVYGDIDEGLDSVNPDVSLSMENNKQDVNISVETYKAQQVEPAIGYLNVRQYLTGGYVSTGRFFVFRCVNKSYRPYSETNNDEYITGVKYFFVWICPDLIPNIDSLNNFVINFIAADNYYSNADYTVIILTKTPPSESLLPGFIHEFIDKFYSIDPFAPYDIVTINNILSYIGYWLEDFYISNYQSKEYSPSSFKYDSNNGYYKWDYRLMNMHLRLYTLNYTDYTVGVEITAGWQGHSTFNWAKFSLDFSNIYNKQFILFRFHAAIDKYFNIYKGETINTLLDNIVSYFSGLGYNITKSGNSIVLTHNTKVYHGGFEVVAQTQTYKTPVLSKNVTHYFSIAYKDRYGRISYGNTPVKINNTLPYFYDNGVNIGKLKYTIHHKPPEYAVSYLWLYGGSNISDKRMYYLNNNHISLEWNYTYFDVDNIIADLGNVLYPYSEVTQEITNNTVLRIIGYASGLGIKSFSKTYVYEVIGKDANGRIYTNKIDDDTEVVDAINNNLNIVCEIVSFKEVDEESIVYYNTGLEFPIENGYHYGEVQTQTNNQPAIGYLDIYDAVFQYNIVRTDYCAFVETPYFSIIYPSHITSWGKPNIISKNIKRERYIKLRHGGKFYHDAEYNYMFSFDADDEKWLNKKYGGISKMIMRGDTLRVYQERKICSVYLGMTLAMSPDGNEIYAQTNDILGYIRESAEDFGCLHPLSVVSDERYVYFFDSINMDLIRDTVNGFHTLGLLYKCKSFFVSIVNNGIDNYKVIGGYDKKTGVYYLTFKHKFGGDSYTIGFNETFNKFDSFYSFYPDLYINTERGLFSSVTGSRNVLFKHGYSEHCKFYDNTVHESYVVVNSNKEPGANKLFLGVGIHSNKEPLMDDKGDVKAIGRNGEERVSLIPEFKLQEGVYRSEILRDMNDLDNEYYSLYNGRQIKGGVGLFKIRFNSSNEAKLRFVEINYLPQL